MWSTTINFKDGFRTHKEQKLRLGEVVMDEHGDRWSYVKAGAAITAGRVVRDSLHTDLLGNSGIGTVTTASRVGSDRLIDSGEFANKEYLRGGVGIIRAGGAAGTAFYVREVIDDDTLRIVVLSRDLDFKHREGWPVATTTASTYTIKVPGLARHTSTTRRIFARGVAQVDIPSGEYGYVKQSGLAWVKLPNSVAIAAGTELVPGADGTIIGLATNSLTNFLLSRVVIGRVFQQGVTANPGRHALAQLDIVNNACSYAFPDDRVAYNYTDVQGRT